MSDDGESINPLDRATLNAGDFPSASIDMNGDDVDNDRMLDELNSEPFCAEHSQISYQESVDEDPEVAQINENQPHSANYSSIA